MKGVSIIICCHNSSTRIEPTLRHLQSQEVKDLINWEVVLIDNASNDDTSQKAKDIWNQNPVVPLAIYREEQPGLMHARNLGLKKSAYDIVSYIDDDNWVENKWVQKVFTILNSDEKIAACGGRTIAAFEGKLPDWFSIYENNYAVGKQMDTSGLIDNVKGHLWGAGLSFKKKIWAQLMKLGFRNLTIGREGNKVNAGEDTELCYAFRLLGYSLFYEDDLVLQHFIPGGRLQVSYLAKMMYGFGKANVRLSCYKQFLYPGFIYKSWPKEFLYASRMYLYNNFWAYLSTRRETKLAKNINSAYWKGVARQLMVDKSSITTMSEDIKQTFKLANSDGI